MINSARCQHCNAPLSIVEKARSDYCRASICQRAQIQDDINQKAAIKHQINALARKEKQLSPDEPLHVILLPTNTNEVVPLNLERKTQFIEHLADVYDQLETGEDVTNFAYKNAEQPNLTIEEEKLLNKACATCKGQCCLLGKNHAFQDIHSLGRYLAMQPKSKEELLADFKQHLPEKSYNNGCIFQGELGCTLPKTMRANTCNSFTCKDLQSYHLDLKHQQAELTVAAAVYNHQITNLTVFDEHQIHQLTLNNN